MVRLTLDLNVEYLKEHAEEIINCKHLISPYLMRPKSYYDDETNLILERWGRVQSECGNLYLFGPGERYIKEREKIVVVL